MRVIADPQVSVRFVDHHAADGSVIVPVSVPPSPLNADMMSAVEKITTKNVAWSSRYSGHVSGRFRFHLFAP